MFYWLFYEKLFHVFTPFRVFQYATFRTGMASLTALGISIALGPWMIARLREFQIGQHIREDGPQSHLKKAGTPTMGGLLICCRSSCRRCCGRISECPPCGWRSWLDQFWRGRVSGRLFEGETSSQSGSDGEAGSSPPKLPQRCWWAYCCCG